MSQLLSLPHRFDFNGRQIAWGTLGRGEPLVLVHGTPFSSQVWRRIAPWLARHRQVFFFDLLGYGESEQRVGDDVSLGVQNHVLTALVSECGLDQPKVLAHDFGGATALRGHFINGLDYRRLTLVDPIAVSPQGSPFVSHVRRHEQAFAGLPGYAHRALLDAYLQTAAANPLSPASLEIHAAPWLGEAGQAAFYRQIAQMDARYTEEIELQYAPRPFPVQIIWGAEDTWIPIDHGRRLARALTDGQLITVPDAGHLIQEDAPEAIVAAMLA